MRLVTAWFGTFITDDDGRILEKALFPGDPGEISKRLQAMDAGEVLPDERKLAAGRPLCVREKRLAELGDVLDFPQPDLRPDDFGFRQELLGRAMLLKGRDKVRAQATPDEHIVQAIRTIDDLTRIINLMSERLHEWQDLNFPELEKLVPEATYLELVAGYGDRRAMLAAGKVKDIDSLGADLSEVDAGALKSFARTILDTVQEKQNIEKYVEEKMKEIAPNLAYLAGPLIGARLISLTGGLERLAKLPASTVQLLGAEKALFKHLKENARPPKHGVIFQHPMIHRAPQWQRGKIARAFAAKLSIAAKMDWNKGRFIGPELEAGLNKRVEDIKKRYPTPKPKARPKLHKKSEARKR
jgi:nucleolar protein 56